MKISRKKQIITFTIAILVGMAFIFLHNYYYTDEFDIKASKETYYTIFISCGLSLLYFIYGTKNVVRKIIEFVVWIAYLSIITTELFIESKILQYVIIGISFLAIIYLISRFWKEKAIYIAPKSFIVELSKKNDKMIFFNMKAFCLAFIGCAEAICVFAPSYIVFAVIELLAIVLTALKHKGSQEFYVKEKDDYILEYVFVALSLLLTHIFSLINGYFVVEIFNCMLTIICMLVAYFVFERKYFEEEIKKRREINSKP